MSVAAGVTGCDFSVVGTQPESLMLLGSSSGLFPSFCSALGKSLSISASSYGVSLLTWWFPGSQALLQWRLAAQFESLWMDERSG